MEGGDARDVVIELLLDLSSVYHVLDPWDSQGCLCDVGGHHTQAVSGRRWVKDAMLETIFLVVNNTYKNKSTSFWPL